MNEPDDQLHAVLREWEAPAPTASGLDARVRAAYRAIHRRSLWQRIWSSRVTIPLPVLAAVMLLIAVVLWFQFRNGKPGVQPMPQPATVAAPDRGYTTRIETAGFKPLPDGATRVIRSGVKQ